MKENKMLCDIFRGYAELVYLTKIHNAMIHRMASTGEEMNQRA